VNTDRLGNYSGELKQGVDALAGLTKRTRRIKEFRRAGDRLSLASHNAPPLSEMRHDFLGQTVPTNRRWTSPTAIDGIRPENQVRTGLPAGGRSLLRNVFAGVKTIFRFGVTNRKIATDPTAGITYKAKRDPKRKRQPFTLDEARLILGAARDAGPELFFPNLIGAFSGTRLAEVVEAHTDDVEMIDGLWCLNLLGNSHRRPLGSIRREGRNR
jgi:integrase